MQLHELIAGSAEWHQHRLTHFNASEAAAMLGLSPHVTRSELLRMKHTGIAKEYSEWLEKNIFADGHAAETAARPIIDKLVGQDLYPQVWSEGSLSVSCDGLTMDCVTLFEHKQWNEALAESVRNGILPDEHQPQVQQGMMVVDARQCIFVVSDGTADKMESLWVAPDHAWRQRIERGWAQFAEDLKNYQPPTDATPPEPSAIEALPALIVQVEGKVLTTNLDAFKSKALTFIGRIKTDLTTDQDFADADAMTKFLADGEDRLKLAKAQALAQTQSIDELFRAIDYIGAEMRGKRLTLERLVKDRKQAIRDEIVVAGRTAFAKHVAGLNVEIAPLRIPASEPDFAAAIRGRKTITSLRDAIDTELANAKINTSAAAAETRLRLAWFNDYARGFEFLFPDLQQIIFLS